MEKCVMLWTSVSRHLQTCLVSMHAGVIVFNVSFYTAAFVASRNERGRPCIVFLEVYDRDKQTDSGFLLSVADDTSTPTTVSTKREYSN